MKRLSASAICLLAAASWSCGRAEGPPRQASARPSGNGVWFADGFATERDESQGLEGVAAGGFSWVLLPAARVEKLGAGWQIERHAAPPRAVTGVAVCPIIEAGRDAAAALTSREKRARSLFADALAKAIREVSGDVRLGRIAGVHLDFPSTPQNAPALAEVLGRIRPHLPRGLFVSVSIAETGPAEGQERWAPLAEAADGFVAMVFGTDDRVDAAAMDALRRPWWAGYSPNSRGHWKGSRGEDRGAVPGGFLARLSDDPRLQFQHDMEVEERAGYGYTFRVRRPVVIEGRSFAAGDEIDFQQPSWADLIRRLGQDAVGRRNLSGRIVRLAGASESDRIFSLPAFNEIVRGRPLVPALHVTLERGKGTVTLAAENGSPIPSALSRVTNWIEVDLTRPGVRDVRNGGFDRYELYSASGKRVSMGRASRVRFYETLISPSEKIEPAVIVTRAPLAALCCRFRYHVLSAAGPEAATEWRASGSP